MLMLCMMFMLMSVVGVKLGVAVAVMCVCCMLTAAMKSTDRSKLSYYVGLLGDSISSGNCAPE